MQQPTCIHVEEHVGNREICTNEWTEINFQNRILGRSRKMTNKIVLGYDLVISGYTHEYFLS